MHERESPAVSQGGPVSGANATTPVVSDGSGDGCSGLLSLSLRNKNKARNFRSLLGRPLAPKIVFEGTKPQTALIAPSSRSSLPANLFVTSVNVEEGLQREKKKRKMREEYGDKPTGAETDIEAIVTREWATLARVTSEKQVAGGVVVGYKVRRTDSGWLLLTRCRRWGSTRRRRRPGSVSRSRGWCHVTGRGWSCGRCVHVRWRLAGRWRAGVRRRRRTRGEMFSRGTGG